MPDNQGGDLFIVDNSISGWTGPQTAPYRRSDSGTTFEAGAVPVTISMT